MKKILYILLLFPFWAIGQSPQQNYVKTHTYHAASTVTDTAAAQISVTYLDGLGRPIQKIAGRANPDGKDIITHIEYDDLGRQVKEFLPYASDDYNYLFEPSALAKTEDFYNVAKYQNTTNPYSETFYDASPLNRTTKQAAPGLPWKGNPDIDYNPDNDNDHTVKHTYTVNGQYDVRYFAVTFPEENGIENTEETILKPRGYYKPGQLYKTITKDENWTPADGVNKTIEEHTDMHGRMVMKRTYDDSQAHDTYYVYDKFSNLTYVVPPLASDQIVEVTSSIDFIGVAYPWTLMGRVDQRLAEEYNRALEAYDNSEILNLDLLHKYGGQGGFSIVPDDAGGLAVNLNITTTQPLALQTGPIVDLTPFGNFPDKEQGRLTGPGFEYYFLIRNNNLVVDGYGDVPSIYLNTTLTGGTPLDYSHNYPWTKVLKADPKVAADYERDIAHLDNSEILTTYTANSYQASGGVSVSLDEEDDFTLSFNISTATPLELNNGEVFPLDLERSLPDTVLGTVSGDNYQYEFSLKNNSLHVIGYGPVTTLTFWNTRQFKRVENIREEVVDGLCYIYHYDSRDRMVEKKIPGKGWEHIVYDKLDRVVLTQDQNLRDEDQWLFTKYDLFGRVAYSGQYTDAKERLDLQQLYNSSTGFNETRQEGYVNDGMEVGYSNKVHPMFNNTQEGEHTTLYTIAYYDTDDDIDMNGISVPTEPPYPIPTTSTKALAVGYKVRVLDTDDWIYTMKGYDEKGREIWSHSKNTYLDSEDIIKTSVNFLGRPRSVTKTHIKAGLPDLPVYETYSYDKMGRLLTNKQSQTPQSGWDLGPYAHMITENTYDALGQLEKKGVGGKTNQPDRLQIVDYKYNVRGWLTDINNINDNLPGVKELFAFRINYNTTQLSQSSPLYNGNISETRWKTRTDNRTRSYRYSYDSMNRLTDAVYSGYTLQNVSTTQNENYRERVSYDKNGNIGTMLRYGLKVHATNPVNNTIGIIDQLTYYYEPNSNRLKKVTDASGRTEGFTNGSSGSGDDYDYDGNGNMTTDLNKGIGTVQAYKIQYNHLNLPTTVQFTSTKKINYTYDATGTKLQKRVTEGSTVTTTQYDNGFIYEKGNGANELKFFNHAEGYVKVPLPSGSGYSPNNFEYIYQYKDHLGNVRVSYREASSGNLEIIEENHYYAFGLQHKGYNNNVLTTGSSQAQKYKYNGKELQDELNLGWYDYQARNYDPALGKWFNIDPLAEKSRRFSPYAYCLDNPVYFIDPDGMEAEDSIDAESKTEESGEEVFDAGYGRKVTRSNSTFRVSGIGLPKDKGTGDYCKICPWNRTEKYSKDSNVKYAMYDKESVKDGVDGEWVPDRGSNLVWKALRAIFISKLGQVLKIPNLPSNILAGLDAIAGPYQDLEIKYRLVNQSTIKSFNWYGQYTFNIFTNELVNVEFEGTSPIKTISVINENTALEFGVFDSKTNKLIYSNIQATGVKTLREAGIIYPTKKEVLSGDSLPLKSF